MRFKLQREEGGMVQGNMCHVNRAHIVEADNATSGRASQNFRAENETLLALTAI